MNGEDKSKDPEKEVKNVASTEKSEKKLKNKQPKKPSDKKPEKMTAGIDPKLAAKFKEKSAELKERIHKEQLEDKIRHHTISPMKAIVPGIAGILLVITCIIFFSSFCFSSFSFFFFFLFFFFLFFFFFNDTATTEIYTLSLHDALPI